MTKAPFTASRRFMRRVCCLVLALGLFAPGAVRAQATTQVFILHSYSQEYPWTRGQHEAFIQALAADAQLDPLVSTEYLDTKRRSYDAIYAHEVARHFTIKYADYRPTAIYITDDNALLFARDHLSRIFPGSPVIFSGVNDYSVQSRLDPALFTGVFEHKEFAPNIEWLRKLDKNANDLVFVGDGSNTYLAIEKELRTALIPYGLRAAFVADKRLDRVLAQLRGLPGRYTFLTTLGGMTDAKDAALTLRETLKSLVGTGRIHISMEDAYVIEGVLGGYVTNGREQGSAAARLLLDYLHGKPIADLPPILKSPNALIFDDQALQKHQIDLPDELRSRSFLLHPRPDFYEKNRSLIIGLLIGSGVLLFLVVVAYNFILYRKHRELKRVHSEVRTLKDFLPICSFCKKIRDDDGYWNQLEAYIHENSGAEFSHGICEDCMKKHYPDDMDDDLRGSG